jgi:transposase-like protein
MKRSKLSDEQITYALRQHESGTAVAAICRRLGVSEATFYVWRSFNGRWSRYGARAHTAILRQRTATQSWLA